MKKTEIFNILYINEKKELTSAFGKELKVGSVEYSWYDINKKLRIYINKNNFIMRTEVIKVGR